LGDPKTNEIYDPMKAHSIMSSENCFTPFREKRSKIYWRGISMLGHGDSVGYKYCMEKAGDWMCGSSIGCMYAGRARSRLGFYELSIELFEKSRLIHLNEISSSDPEREVFMDYCAFSDLRIDGWKGRALKELESPEMRALGERLESFAIENSWKEFQ
jgi:hypothetical protein